jgi:hypothetical protein
VDEASPFEERLYSIYRHPRQPNFVHLLFADCHQLENMRVGRNHHLHDFGHVMSPRRIAMFNGLSRDEFLDQIADHIRQSSEHLPDRVDNSIYEWMNRILADETTGSRHIARYTDSHSLGVLQRDGFAIYHGLLQSVRLTNGERRQIAVVHAATLLGVGPIFININTILSEDRDIHRLLMIQQEMIHNLHALNTQPRPSG